MRISDWSSDVCSSDLDLHAMRDLEGDEILHDLRKLGRRIAAKRRAEFHGLLRGRGAEQADGRENIHLTGKPGINIGFGNAQSVGDGFERRRIEPVFVKQPDRFGQYFPPLYFIDLRLDGALSYIGRAPGREGVCQSV